MTKKEFTASILDLDCKAFVIYIVVFNIIFKNDEMNFYKELK